MKGIKKEYLMELRRLLRRIYKPQLAYLWRKAGRAGEWKTPRSISPRLAYAFAVLWKLKGSEKDFNEAKELLLCFRETHVFVSQWGGGAYQILKSRLSAAERHGSGSTLQWIRVNP